MSGEVIVDGRPEDGDSWDVCIVLPYKKEEEEEEEEAATPGGDDEEGLEVPKELKDFGKVVRRLTLAGLEYASYMSVQQDEVYVKIRMPLTLLREQADISDFIVKLDAKVLEKRIHEGFDEFGIKGIQLGNDYDGRALSQFGPYEHIHAKYDTSPVLADLYSEFSTMQRCKIVASILIGSRRFGGCEIPIPKRVHQGRFLAFLPFHDRVERTALQNKWMSTLVSPIFVPGKPGDPNLLPYDAYRDYFGEAHGFYIKFLGHSARMMGLLGVPGLCVYGGLRGAGYGNGPAAGILRAIYAVILMIWCAAFSRVWSRAQSFTAFTWGMSEFEQDEPPRPQYKGKMIASPVDGKEELYFPRWKRRGRVYFGVFLSAFVLAVDITFVFLVLRYRNQGSKRARARRSFRASVLNAVGIQVFNYVYKTIAIKISQHENWRTETEFADRLTVKLFAFNFVNSYFALFILLFSGSNKVCSSETSCITQIETSLLSIFILALLTDAAVAIVLPFVMRKYNRYKEGGFSEPLSSAEWQYLLLEYDETLDAIQGYMTITMRYGYVALFSSAAPLVPFLAAVCDVALLKLEPYKFLTAFRRIEPRGGQDIGRFETACAFIGAVSPITNAVVVIIRTPPFSAIHPLARQRYVFMCVAAVAICFQLLISALVPAVHPDVTLQLQRQAFIRSKVIDKIADEDEKIQATSRAVNFEIARKGPVSDYKASLQDVLLAAN
ncbi:hypothetical protein CTAYLR_001288 [Chrysophaeum taylorii]|uniref:Anoctamin transmembrane domain-containing protein n=1 Tax=Chrysophaeum taylorii TaxID=2483200 RepID=A0AAD7UEN6_9STRA|nr:hypothetical protein CTAYLR_001288 [Chrysophaeum taylorii]